MGNKPEYLVTFRYAGETREYHVAKYATYEAAREGARKVAEVANEVAKVFCIWKKLPHATFTVPGK